VPLAVFSQSDNNSRSFIATPVLAGLVTLILGLLPEKAPATGL